MLSSRRPLGTRNVETHAGCGLCDVNQGTAHRTGHLGWVHLNRTQILQEAWRMSSISQQTTLSTNQPKQSWVLDRFSLTHVCKWISDPFRLCLWLWKKMLNCLWRPCRWDLKVVTICSSISCGEYKKITEGREWVKISTIQAITPQLQFYAHSL